MEAAFPAAVRVAAAVGVGRPNDAITMETKDRPNDDLSFFHVSQSSFAHMR
jgi:hypothetical protein